MLVAAYEDKFHLLSWYVAHLLKIEEERIHLFIKGLNTGFLIFALKMTSSDRSCQEIVDFVK